MNAAQQAEPGYGRVYSQADLDALVAAHSAWLHGDPSGVRARAPGGVFRALLFRSPDLRGGLFPEAEFDGSDMTGVDFRGPETDISFARFVATIVDGMRLAGSRRRGADFSGSDTGGTDRPYGYRRAVLARGATAERDLFVLMGISGVGKSSTARVLGKRLGPRAALDCEERAFNRRFIFGAERNDPSLHAAVVEHCATLVGEWAAGGEDVVVVDRWYETYFTELGLPASRIGEIEGAIVGAGFRGHLVHLVVADDLGAMARREAHTRSQRPAAWSTEGSSVEASAARALECQARTRGIAAVTRLDYREVDATGMDWERIADEVLKGTACAVPDPAASRTGG